MNAIKKFIKNIKDNFAEYYTLFMIAVAVPFAVGLLVGYQWGLLLSFVLQGLVGIFYIRGKQ